MTGREKNKKLNKGEKVENLADTNLIHGKSKIQKEERREEKSKEKETVKEVPETVKEENSEDEYEESDFEVQKGKGAPLKEIPNVVYKLKQQSTSFLVVMHGVLYGLHGEEEDFEENILQFSGFAQYPNEENRKDTVKERLEKLQKEMLARLCSVFDIQVPRVLDNVKKNKIVEHLLEFMEAPYAINEDQFSGSEKSTKKRKLRREINLHAQKQSTRTRKSHYKGISTESDASSSKTSLGVTNKEKDEEIEENKEDEETEENDKNALDDEHKENDDEEPEENKGDEEIKEYKEEEEEEETRENDKNALDDEHKEIKSSENEENNNTISENLKDVDIISIKKEPNLEKFSYKRIVEGGDKSPEVWSDPNCEELKKGICDILDKIDLTITNFSDVLEKLEEYFEMDLSPRKDAIMVMIEDELYRLAGEAHDEDEDDKK